MKKVLVMLLAGGKGERLYPLTRDRAKPAVPFGGAWRIIDFTISNCINSEFRKIYVLTQYKSFSLDRHIQRAWNIPSERFGEFVYIAHAQQRINENWYKGTADAIYQNFYTLQQEKPDLVLVVSGDHIYKMDYRPLIKYHLKNKADLTIATIEMHKQYSKEFGVLVIDNANQVVGFQEKPSVPETIPGKPDQMLINMGVYVFNTDILVKRLIENAKKPDTHHDFGKNIIPAMIGKDRVFSYSFLDKKTGKPAYWRDVGTISAFYDANMELLEENPQFNIYDDKWPILGTQKLALPARISGFEQKKGMIYGLVQDSSIARGCSVYKTNIGKSLLFPNVSVGAYSDIQGAILFDNVRIGKNCVIKNTIIDKGVTVPDNTQIGVDHAADKKIFDVDRSGIVTVPKNTVF